MGAVITLRQLEVFCAAARHGSFRRCAEQLGMSQVAVSEHVRMLEDRLGCLLFDRSRGGPAVLTPLGRQASQRLSTILADLNDFIDEIANRGGRDQRSVSISMPGFLLRNLYDEVSTFSKAHAELDFKLDVHDLSSEDAIGRFRQRLLDIVYVYALDDTDAPGTQFLRHEPLAIFVGPLHPLAGKALVTARELCDTPCVQLEQGNSLQSLVGRALASIGVTRSPVEIESHDFGVLLSSLQQNRGYICMFAANGG